MSILASVGAAMALTVVVTVPAPASAQEVRIDKGVLQSLTNLVTAEASQHPRLEVISAADVREMMALEQQKAAVGCEAESCMAEIASAMGARLAVSGQLSRLGSILMLNLSMFDAEEGKVVARKLLRGKSIEVFADSIPVALRAMLQKVDFPKPPDGKTEAPTVALLVLDVKGQLDPEPEPTPPPPAHTSSSSSSGSLLPSLPAITMPDVPGMPTPMMKDEGALAMLGCLQRALPRALQSEARYRSWRKGDDAPTCKERYVSYGLYNVYHDAVDRCRRAAAAVAGKLEQPAKRVAHVVAETYPVIDEAARYYLDEDYEEDGCKRGIALHTKLLQAFGKLRTVAQEVVPVIEKQVIHDVDQAARAEGNRHRKALLQVTLRALEAAQASPVLRDDVDGTKLKKRFKPLVPKLKAVRDAAKKLRDLPEPDSILAKTVWNGMRQAAEARARQFIRPLRPYKKKKQAKRNWERADPFDPLELREVAWDMADDLTSSTPL